VLSKNSNDPPRLPLKLLSLSSWHFERDAFPYALETDWLAGAAGFEPLHLMRTRQDSPPMRRDSNLCISEFEFTETLNPGCLELAHLDAEVGRVQRL
jgi:hypothetical protein